MLCNYAKKVGFNIHVDSLCCVTVISVTLYITDGEATGELLLGRNSVNNENADIWLATSRVPRKQLML